MDSRSDAGLVSRRVTRRQTAEGGWLAIGEGAGGMERQQWARGRSPTEAVHPRRRALSPEEPLGSRHGDQPIPATMLAVRWASVARGLSGWCAGVAGPDWT